MTNLLLGLIALGVLIMAATQIAVMTAAFRAARQVGEVVNRFEQDVRPIVVNLQKASEEAARASTLAAMQVERLDGLVGNIAQRVEDTAAVLQQTIVQPAQDWLAMLQIVKNVVSSFRPSAARPSPPRDPSPAAADDELFIG